jgi:hypothetical protein
MSISGYYKTLGEIEDRVTARMADLRQAEREVAIHCNGMAFDGASAEEVYRAGLDHLGVSRRDTSGMAATELRILLKNLPLSGAGGVVTRSPAAMAFDASEGSSPLDSILKGIKPPRDLSTRNDFRR